MWYDEDPPNELIEWTNWRECRRFIRVERICPFCHVSGGVWEDHWPPDYGHGSSATNLETGEHWSEYSGSMKYVCLDCHVAFRVSTTRKSEGAKVETKESVSEAVPLVGRNGKWLTPHDQWREEYREKNGEYPEEAYA